MSSKRKRGPATANDVNDGGGGEAPSSAGYATSARVDATYGQRSAFPGLDDDDGATTEATGGVQDGLSYLRMVR